MFWLTGEALLTLKGHTGPVLSVAYSPDGKRLAATSFDGMKVWDAQTGQEILTIPVQGNTGSVWCVAYSPDGKRLATASTDGTVQLYALDIFELMRLAHARTSRELSPEECLHYLQVNTCPSIP